MTTHDDVSDRRDGGDFVIVMHSGWEASVCIDNNCPIVVIRHYIVTAAHRCKGAIVDGVFSPPARPWAPRWVTRGGLRWGPVRWVLAIPPYRRVACRFAFFSLAVRVPFPSGGALLAIVPRRRLMLSGIRSSPGGLLAVLPPPGPPAARRAACAVIASATAGCSSPPAVVVGSPAAARMPAIRG